MPSAHRMIRRLRAWPAIFGCLIWFGLGPAHAAEAITGYVSVHDGDRLDIDGRRLALTGVDAPERRQTCADAQERLYACGRAAEAALVEKVGGKVVTCVPTATDRNRAVCRLGEEDLGAWLVERGLAIADRAKTRAYAAQEEAAKSAGRGVWAGAFTRPWDWREGVRGKPDGYATPLGTPQPDLAAAKSGPNGCAIKGNITREGTKLYWVPGSRRYAETVITEAAGERWFCTEEEAKAAGWQEPQK